MNFFFFFLCSLDIIEPRTLFAEDAFFGPRSSVVSFEIQEFYYVSMFFLYSLHILRCSLY